MCKCTVFALWDVAAFITPLGVRGVAPRTDPISIWVPAVVQLQAVGRRGGPPEMNRDRVTVRTAGVTAWHSDFV